MEMRYNSYRKQENIIHAANTLPDEELLARFLDGDIKLLGAFLMSPCYPAFCSFSRKFFSLGLEPDEIVSIASIHVTEYNMSVLRAYNPCFFAKIEAGETSEEKKTKGVQRYVVKMTSRKLGSMLKRELKTIGGARGKGWKIEAKNANDESAVLLHKMRYEGVVVPKEELELDAKKETDYSKNVKAILDSFNTTAVDLHISMSKLPLLEQKIFHYCSIQDLSAKSVAKKLDLTEGQVYRIHQEAKESLKNLIQK